MYAFLALALLILTAFLVNRPCLAERCARQSTDKSKPPTFLCSLNVTVVHLSGCEVQITERILYPHTTGRKVRRDLLFIQGSQTLADIHLHRDGKKLRPRTIGSGHNVLRVWLPTEQSATPVLFNLTFIVTNGVLRMDRTCNATTWPMRTNFLSWDSGKWNESIDMLSVRFQASGNDMLSVVPGDYNVSHVSRNSVAVVAENVNTSLSVYVRQNSTQVCPRRLNSCQNGSTGSLAWLAVPMSALLICACAGCIVANAGKGQRGRAHPEQR